MVNKVPIDMPPVEIYRYENISSQKLLGLMLIHNAAQTA